MIGVWQTLLWKEWREQRSVLLILTAFFVLVPVIFSLRTPTNYFGALSITFYAIPLISMFIAMNLAAGEQSSGTIGFLQALPVSRRKAAAAKLLAATVVVVAPIGLAVGAAALLRLAIGREAFEVIAGGQQIFGREEGNWFANRLILPPVAAISFLLWIAAAGVNRKDEVRAGAVGLLATLAYWLGVEAIDYLLKWMGLPGTTLIRGLSAVGAGGIVTFNPAEVRWAPYWWLAIVAHLAIAAWFVTRFGRLAPGRVQAVEPVRATQLTTWLAPPRRSPLAAIIWKQTRESLPLAAMGATCIAAIGVFAYFDARQQGGYGFVQSSHMLAGTAVGWMLVGMMVATVAGIGVFMEDLSPGLHSFWRSRPIKLGQWFAVKYVTGFATTFVTLAVPLLAVGVFVLVQGDRQARHLEDAPMFASSGALAQWALFNSAMAAIILLRRPIHAAFAALTVTAIAFAAGTIFAENLAGGPIGGDYRADLIVSVLAVAFACGAALLAWFAVRNDWGWKR